MHRKVADGDESLRLLEEGGALEVIGRLDEALRCYELAVEIIPSLGRGHFNRGNVLLELGRVEEALCAYDRALECKPDSPGGHFNRGNACARLGRHDKAIAAYRRALELNPGFVDAEVAQGVVLEELGRQDEAVCAYRRALQVRPDYAQVHFNLGRLFFERRDFESAEFHFKEAVAVDANYPDALNGLGAIYRDSGRFGDALNCYRRVYELDSGRLDVIISYAESLKHAGNLDEALAVYEKAIHDFPDDAGLLSNKGLLLFAKGNALEAVEVYHQALKLSPGDTGALCNLGVAYLELRRFEDAVACWRGLLNSSPGEVAVLNNLGCALADLGRLNEAVEAFQELLTVNPDYFPAFSNLLLISNYMDEEDAQALLPLTQKYGEAVSRLARPFSEWRSSANASRMLRVGLVSGDLRDHPVGFFLAGVLEALARKNKGSIVLQVYSTHPLFDGMSERIKSLCVDWVLVSGFSDEALAQRIHQDAIDILIDLSGHSAHNRLPAFAWKPAPVQVSWLGYFATTGVVEMDYVIADPWTLPESEEKNFSETVWRLPETRLCFTVPEETVPVSLLPALSNRCVTFGCFNNLSKINDEVVALWSRILKSVPGSRLLLKCKQVEELSIRNRMKAHFAAYGVPESSLVFEMKEPRIAYLSAYHRVDIGLDPFPYPGGTTTVESLWMGVPVLTLAGERFLSRQGMGLLMNAGLPDWIATDKDDYVARAIKHAGDLPRLALLRSQLRQQVLASPIFDAERFAGHFEDALRGMWKKWCEKALGVIHE